MSRRGNTGMVASSPLLIGAVTVLVTIIAVFLSYNANSGLPFVPTYELRAQVPNASGLVVGNEVRIGGARAGVLREISARTRADGGVTAVLRLALDVEMRPLPVDSTLMVRPRSALGLKYVEITRGTSERGFEENARIPVSRAQVRPVEIDDFFNTFDDPTRVGSRTNLESFGDAFAARGESLNRAFADFEPVLRNLEPVMRTIASSRAEFDEFFPALEQAASEVSPVADTQAAMFVALDQTFEELERVNPSIQAAISGGPPALDVATAALPAQRPFLRTSEDLFRRFRPAFASIASASPDLAGAFRAGQASLPGAPALNRRFTRTFRTLEDLAADERFPRGLRWLTDTTRTLAPTLSFVTPAQTECNYLAILTRNVQSALSESDRVGSLARIGVLALPQLPGSEAGPAADPANGPVAGTPGSTTDDSFLHSNPYPNTVAPGQVQECEAGNERYLKARRVIGNVPGDQGTANELLRRRLR